MKRSALKKELHGAKNPPPPLRSLDGKPPAPGTKIAQLAGSTRSNQALRPGIEQYIREYGSFANSQVSSTSNAKRPASAQAA